MMKRIVVRRPQTNLPIHGWNTNKGYGCDEVIITSEDRIIGKFQELVWSLFHGIYLVALAFAFQAISKGSKMCRSLSALLLNFF